MKTVQSGSDSPIRVSNEEAETLVKRGFKYVGKEVWKKAQVKVVEPKIALVVEDVPVAGKKERKPRQKRVAKVRD